MILSTSLHYTRNLKETHPDGPPTNNGRAPKTTPPNPTPSQLPHSVQRPRDPFVQREVQADLQTHADEARGHASVEPQEALGPEDLLEAVEGGGVAACVCVVCVYVGRQTSISSQPVSLHSTVYTTYARTPAERLHVGLDRVDRVRRHGRQPARHRAQQHGLGGVERGAVVTVAAASC